MGPNEFIPTTLERIASSPATGLAATALAAGVATMTPLALFLSFLFSSLNRPGFLITQHLDP